jgi:microcystin-dependent protein
MDHPGNIILAALDFVPKGFLPCDGSPVDAKKYPELSKLAGKNLPNLPDFHTCKFIIQTDDDADGDASELPGPPWPPAGLPGQVVWTLAAGTRNDCFPPGHTFDLHYGTQRFSDLLGFTPDDRQKCTIPAVSTLSDFAELCIYLPCPGYDDFQEPFLGEIRLCGGEAAPRGWEYCDGRLMLIVQNNALFALFGTRYGGDGRTTFKLPQLPDDGPFKYVICTTGVFPSRS